MPDPRPDAHVLVALAGEPPDLVPATKARIPPTDRGLLFGDGVFETVRAYAGHVFRLQDHLDRLRRSAGAIALEVPWSDAELADAVERTFAANDLSDGLARMTVTRGDGWTPEVPKGPPRLIVMAGPVRRGGAPPAPVELALVEGLPPFPGAKTLSRLVHVAAKLKAEARGFDDAVFVDADGHLVEATSANLFLVEEDALVTPPCPPALDGVTRRVVMDAAERLRVRVREEPISEDRAVNASDAFLTSTGVEVRPVAKIEARAYKGRAKLTERMARAVRGQVQEALREAGVEVPVEEE